MRYAGIGADVEEIRFRPAVKRREAVGEGPGRRVHVPHPRDGRDDAARAGRLRVWSGQVGEDAELERLRLRPCPQRGQKRRRGERTCLQDMASGRVQSACGLPWDA